MYFDALFLFSEEVFDNIAQTAKPHCDAPGLGHYP